MTIRLVWDSTSTGLYWGRPGDPVVGDMAIGENPWRMVVMDHPWWDVADTVLGKIHRCGRQVYYAQWWDGKPQQCAACHSRQVARHQREWRAQQRLKRVRLRLRRTYLATVLRQIIAQLT